ncbi:MAG TPA: signal peptidase I [Methanomassiliicoccales archaeon]|nr:signal peptidase I [Methanomassiliicoccales archaeon]HNX48102.1 signal peptidase I [Methanomassiliicoccales archaeon]HPR98308.1 signal peptidase I [Methanomassiliicoccales archaeon]
MKWSSVGTAISVAVLALVLFMAVSPVIGFRFDPVRSGSMSPAIEVGDLAISSSVDNEDIKVGDIIVFRHSGILICHRVIAINAEAGWIQTQGDANEDPDPYTITYDDVVTEVGLVVPYAGHAVLFLKSVYGWVLIFVLIAAMLLLGLYEDREKDDSTSGGEQ